MEIICGEDYPQTSPVVRFTSKVNLDCVDQSNGEILISKFDIMKNWNAEHGMENILIGLKDKMANSSNKSLPQPAEGDMY